MVAEFIAVQLGQAVISQVVEKLADLLANEAKSLSSVRDDVEYLKRELKFMNGFLKDADRRQKQEELVRDWIAEVRDVACEIEDAIEIYVSDVDSAFNSIKNELQCLHERSQTYQIQLNNAEQGTISLRNLRKSYPEEEEDVVSMKDVAMNLKAQLLKEEDELRIVSIVGMGGLGKTTLAKKVYNDIGVKRHFDMSAWVCISRQYVVKEVLIEILLQVGFERKNLGGKSKEGFLTEKTNKREDFKRFEEQDLIGLIQGELKEKKYLVVLDDIGLIQWFLMRLMLNDEFPSLDILVDSAALYKLHLDGRLPQQHSSFLPKKPCQIGIVAVSVKSGHSGRPGEDGQLKDP